MILSHIGCATDPDIRYKATSGGIGSAILKYLFESKIIQTSITFDYNNEDLQYIPRLIYRYEDYNVTGSIYQEIKLIQFIKQHIHEIRGGFACFVLPCQARAIRSILEKAGITNFIIGLTCSSQQNIEATYYFLKRIHIEKKDVSKIQYRGNGWPSGIQIQLTDNSTKYVPNNNSIWSEIFHSRLFIQKKCFYCQNTLNIYSDITLADPWLKEYFSTEKEGLSIIISNTPKGKKLIEDAQLNKYINIRPIDYNKATSSQIGTIKRKESYNKNKTLTRFMINIFTSTIYKKAILNSTILFQIHNKIKNKIESYISNNK